MSSITRLEIILTRAELLSGATDKSWIIVDNFPKVDSISSCNYPNYHSFDNIWTFRNDNTFSFDPGLIKTSDTLNPNACKDPKYFSGTWQLMENESKIKLSIFHSDNVQLSEPVPIFFEIDTLAQNYMILIDYENSNPAKYVFTTREN